MKKSASILALLPALLLLPSCAGALLSAQPVNQVNQTQISDASANAPFSYEPYAAVLNAYVDQKGFVDYPGLQANRQQLDQFNDSLATVTSATYDSWPEAEQIAFWINAYNSLTLKSIVNESPIKESIKDIVGVWRIKQHAVLADGKALTLNNIEHDVLRVDFNEPRIHVAINCASFSCPDLLNEPYTAAKLDVQLDEQTNRFLSNPKGLRIDRETNTVYLSKIFDWFGEDWKATYSVESGFTGNQNEKAVLNFISGYLNADDKAYLEAGNYKVKYMNYDWSLNDQS
ncbi:MAG: DUF547 domain-containing protein [Leptolyngbyaceae cyanobacterium MO_188.B28]|nr:DUF547 domain-containing protein [Leptolyngbyaceae cyanobacterium MO_188.B28]